MCIQYNLFAVTMYGAFVYTEQLAFLVFCINSAGMQPDKTTQVICAELYYNCNFVVTGTVIKTTLYSKFHLKILTYTFYIYFASYQTGFFFNLSMLP